MRNISPIISKLILVWLLCWPALAADAPPVAVESSAEPLDVTIGDRITYRILITAQPGIVITPPAAGENLGKFEIRDYAITGPTQADGIQRYEASYSISIYEVGEHTIPPFRVRYAQAEGQEASIESRPITITVKSLAPEDAEFREIKPEHAKRRDLSNLYTLLAVIGGLIALVIGLIILVKKLRKPQHHSTEPDRPAHLVAYEELNRLRSSDLLETGQLKAYHVQLALILKTYLARRFAIQTIERTTEEIIEDSGKSDMAPEIQSMLRRFLDRCDLVKFAAMWPEREEIEGLWELGKTIVDETRFKIELLPLGSAAEQAGKET